ncbi:MAG: hypothetical protein U0359_05440 [Byssovorax sp.]
MSAPRNAVPFNVPPSAARHGRAIVIGGSITGLVTARVLSDSFAEVIVLERDSRPEGPVPRKGAPQMRHAHLLLGAATSLVRSLFPGLIDEITAAGALLVDPGTAVAMNHYGGWKPRFTTGMECVSASRPFLEWHIRRRVEAIDNIAIRYEQVAGELLVEADRVIGVLVEGTGERLTADLVIDAAGRGTRVPRWLDALGYGMPEEEAIGVDLAYTSHLFEKPQNPPGDWYFLVAYSRPPEQRGAFIFEIENGLWIASMTAYFGDHCPKDHEGFLAHARALPVPEVYEALRNAKPVGEGAAHKVPTSRWFHYEKMVRFPRGLLVMGDSVVSLNPIYGQGMLMSFQCAQALNEALIDRARRGASLDELTAAMRRKVAEIVTVPWMLSTTMDLRFDKARGKRPPGLSALQWAFANLIDLTSTDVEACRIFYEMLHMHRGAEALANPRLLFPLLAYSAKSPFIPFQKRIQMGAIPPIQ